MELDELGHTIVAQDAACLLAEDHKPASEVERSRIMAAGGFLSDIGGVTRVNGNLNLSRAIGDLKYKGNRWDRMLGSSATACRLQIPCRRATSGHIVDHVSGESELTQRLEPSRALNGRVQALRNHLMLIIHGRSRRRPMPPVVN